MSASCCRLPGNGNLLPLLRLRGKRGAAEAWVIPPPMSAAYTRRLYPPCRTGLPGHLVVHLHDAARGRLCR